MRSITPARKLLTTTSASAISAFTAAICSALRRSSATLRLLRFRLQKIGLSMPSLGGKVERLRSPAPARSILITSAP